MGHMTFIPELCEHAKRGYDGDRAAEAELRRLGEGLARVGGFEAMARLQGAMRDYERTNRPTPYSLSAYMGSTWCHVPAWANAEGESTSKEPQC